MEIKDLSHCESAVKLKRETTRRLHFVLFIKGQGGFYSMRDEEEEESGSDSDPPCKGCTVICLFPESIHQPIDIQ